MDKIDLKILERLMKNGRVTWKELAIELKVTPPTIAERVRQLEKSGTVKGYFAQIDPHFLGCGLVAFVSVTLNRPDDRETFIKKIGNLSEVQECHHIAGDFDYLLKIRCADTKSLDILISNELKSMKGVVSTRTTIVLDSVKESLSVPMCIQNEVGSPSYKERKK